MPPTRTSSTPTAPLIALGFQPAPSHAAIAECAYYKYLASGAHPGRCERNWLDAELELNQRAASPLRITLDRTSAAIATAEDTARFARKDAKPLPRSQRRAITD